jgi:hypothetical protein
LKNNIEYIIKGLQVFCLTAVGFLVVGLSILVYQSTGTLHTFNTNMDVYTTKTNIILEHSDTAVLNINKLINDARLSTDNINKAAIDERIFYEKQIPQFTVELHGILQQTSSSVLAIQTIPPRVNNLLDTSANTVAGLQTTTSNINKTILNTNTLITSPEIQQSLINLQTTTANSAETMKQSAEAMKEVNKTAVDLRQGIERTQHGWLYRAFTKVF